jgi:antitoxin ParD1/3/4
MSVLNVTLPDAVRDWLEHQTENGRYASADDYVLDLIRRDKARLDKIAAMQGLIDEGLTSGTGERSSEEIFAEAVKRARWSPDG